MSARGPLRLDCPCGQLLAFYPVAGPVDRLGIRHGVRRQTSDPAAPAVWAGPSAFEDLLDALRAGTEPEVTENAEPGDPDRFHLKCPRCRKWSAVSWDKLRTAAEQLGAQLGRMRVEYGSNGAYQTVMDSRRSSKGHGAGRVVPVSVALLS